MSSICEDLDLDDERVELLDSFIELLPPPDYSLIHRDKFNLRATSKGLDKSLMRWFMKIFQRGHAKKADLVELFMTAQDIRALHDVSNSGTIDEAIKSLHINVGHFAKEPRRPLILHSPLQTEIDAYEVLLLAGDGVKLLSQAFSNLQNLEEVYIGKGRMPLHKHQTDHCAWLETTEPRLNIQKRPGSGYILRTEVVKSVLEALALSGQRIKKLVIQSGSSMSHRDEAGLWSFDLPEPIFAKLATSFQNLTRLHLTMSFAKDRLIHSRFRAADSTDDERLQWLVRFLQAASSLESFHLAASRENFFSSDVIKTVHNALPDSLKEFHLYNSMLTAKVLHQVLALHHRNVTELGLYCCILLDESWEPIFRTLDMYRPRLKHAYLEELWELRPDLDDKVIRGPLPRGVKRFSGRRISHFKRKVCAVSACVDRQRRRDFRDDAMVVQDGYGHVSGLDLMAHTAALYPSSITRKLGTWM
ncbi:hypothetical protein DIS24_g12186 [Lasiodiplodia hormozganensis]|uniref:Uncharacterized protein n=1 Tax=Lasiodiplodia hormozganensis TaxID=869390 RepID=A0AA39W9P1_9PEZI|nr:hypothetical protein DIS24_g12186 [Lasiodiplodia hormozganensis]